LYGRREKETQRKVICAEEEKKEAKSEVISMEDEKKRQREK
jgi:hypothetical protein